jgi:hypothetical protein
MVLGIAYAFYLKQYKKIVELWFLGVTKNPNNKEI